MRGFAVEPEEVDAVVAGLTATQRRLEALADDLDRQIRALHQGWEGGAAAEHETAHRHWRAGLEELRGALHALSAAGTQAVESYRAASADNVTMWRQVS